MKEKVGLIEGASDGVRSLKTIYLKANDSKFTRPIAPIKVGEMEYVKRSPYGVRKICRMRGDERVFRVDRILDTAKATEHSDEKQGRARLSALYNSILELYTLISYEYGA